MYQFIRLAAAAAVAAAFASHASAQQAFDWSGFYFGIHGGAGVGEAEGEAGTSATVTGCLIGGCSTLLTADPSAEADYGIMGLLGGAQIGADYALGSRFLIGVKADVSGSEIDGDGNLANFTVGPFQVGRTTFGPYTLFSADVATDIDWMATIRGRAGVVGPMNALFYLTGGLAIADVNSTIGYTALGTSDSVTSSETRYGWTAGFGGEAPITNRISFGLEYLYTDLGKWDAFSSSDSLDVGLCPLACLSAVSDSAATNELTVQTWRAALNIRLGGSPN